MKRIAAAACAALLAACAGPRPQTPPAAAVVPHSQWRTTVPANAAHIDAQWWTGFGDPALDALVATALDRNIDLAVAAARVDEARAQYRYASGLAGPDVALGFAGGRQRVVSAFGRGLDSTYGQGLVSAAYEVDLFGRLAATTGSAREALLATQDARETLRLAVIATTVSGYVTLLALDARLQLLRETLETRGETVRVARRRADAGYGSVLELRQAETDYHGAEQLIPATQLAIARQEDGLRVLLGLEPGDIHRGGELIALRMPVVPPVGVPSALLRARPDIAQAEHQLASTDQSLDAARAAFMPRLQITASGGHADSNILRNGIDVFAVGGSILAPLFQRGKLHAQADAAAARRDQAAYTYRRTVLVAFREVEDALAAIERLDEQETATAAQRDAASAALQLAINRYRAGYSPYLEQQDAQRILLAGQIALIQVRADRLSAVVSLYQALGGGWEEQRSVR
ncbi:efflux transporter outer membrane subunit [Lysobacter sp. 2RAF19]